MVIDSLKILPLQKTGGKEEYADDKKSEPSVKISFLFDNLSLFWLLEIFCSFSFFYEKTDPLSAPPFIFCRM